MFLIATLLSNISASENISPPDSALLNRVRIIFQWEQQPRAVVYEIQIAKNPQDSTINHWVDSLQILALVDSNLMAIISDSSLDWGGRYLWRARGLDASEEPGGWGQLRSFSIIPPPSVTPYSVTPIMHDSAAFYEGLILTSIANNRESIVMDKTGRMLLWLSNQVGSLAQIRARAQLPNGNYLALSAGRAVEVNEDNFIVWTSLNDPTLDRIHHDAIKLPNGNVMALSRYDKLEFIPPGPWTAHYDSLGIDSVLWRGDVLIEWDSMGNEVWRWDAFDYFNVADWDSMFFAARGNSYNWTHGNALWHDPVEDAIYWLPRRLNRVTKVDHTTGNVIWNMGVQMPSGDVDFGFDLEFRLPHAIKMLPNRNLMMFDNGRGLDSSFSRGLEIAINESGEIPVASIVWEYRLADSLYTFRGGDTDRLPNGNSVITSTVPGYVVEVDSANNKVWEIINPTGYSPFRSERIPGLYPQAFCVIQPDFSIVNNTMVVIADSTSIALAYEIHNEGWLDEIYDYTLTDDQGWVSASSSVAVNSGSKAQLLFTAQINEPFISQDTLRLLVTPRHAPARWQQVQLILLTSALAIAESDGLPDRFRLHPAYPNPFNPVTQLTIEVPFQAKASLIVYDILGREMLTLINKDLTPGVHLVTWEGRTNTGRPAPTGIYIARLTASEYTKSIKLVLLK